MKKQIIKILIAVFIIISVCGCSISNKDKISMYNVNGDTREVEQSQVERLKMEGWYEYPVIQVYNPDGEKRVIKKDEFQKWSDENWYEYPVVAIYSEDGRVKIVPENEMEEWVEKGWTTEDTVTLYSADGETSTVKRDEIEDWLADGWYEYPVVKLYKPNGETKIVAKDEADEYLEDDWYDEPMVTLYSADGKSTAVKEKEKDKWIKDGWSTTKPKKNSSSSTPAKSSTKSGYYSYSNPNFSYSIAVPAMLEEKEYYADGANFYSTDASVRLTTNGFYKTDAQNADELYKLIKSGLEYAPTFTKNTGKIFVFSGYYMNDIVYEKYVINSNNTVSMFRIQYPKSRKKEFDPIVTHIASTLK